MWIEFLGTLSHIETIAVGRRIRELSRLERVYGVGRWRKLKGVASVRIEGGRQVIVEVHWYEARGSDGRSSRSSGFLVTSMARKNSKSHYAVCVSNKGYRSSLVIRRIYKLLDDPDAARRNLIRVIDESGEDYLYSATMFVAIDIPQAVERTFKKAS